MKIKSETAFRELVADIVLRAKETLLEDGFVPLAGIAVPTKGNVRNFDLQQPMNQAEEFHSAGLHEEAVRLKKDLGLMIREVLREIKAIGYINAGQSTVSRPDPRNVQVVHGDEPGKGFARARLPRFDPQHRKAVVVNWEWKGPPEGTYKSGVIIQFFRRIPGGIVLEESTSSEGDPVIGLLTGLLAE